MLVHMLGQAHPLTTYAVLWMRGHMCIVLRQFGFDRLAAEVGRGGATLATASAVGEVYNSSVFGPLVKQ